MIKISLSRKFNFKNDVFSAILKARRSRRRFSGEPIGIDDLAALLMFTTGTRDVVEEGKAPAFVPRHVPSAGGLYPHETYVVVNNVEGLDQGLYHYDVLDHALAGLMIGDLSRHAAAIALDQRMAMEASVVFFWTIVPGRSKWKYLQRAYRYIYLDLGHVGQNFYLVAEALGLAACTIGALYDDEGNEFLGIDGVEETLVYMGVAGRRFP